MHNKHLLCRKLVLALLTATLLTMAAAQTRPVQAGDHDSLHLVDGRRWAVLASRQSLSESVAIAEEYQYGLLGTRVIKSSNGWYAVVAGPYSHHDYGIGRQILLSSHSLPDDFYFSDGAPYVSTAWQSGINPVVAAAIPDEDGGAELTYGDLHVRIEPGKDADGSYTAVAVGAFGGRPAFRVDPDISSSFPSNQLFLTWLDRSAAYPQVVFTAYTGGAHCCTVTAIATQFGADWRVIDAGGLDGGGYVFRDVDGDNEVELDSIDNSFLYAFASYAESFAPRRIHKLEGGRLVDVTTRAAHRQSAEEHVRELESSAAEEPGLWSQNGFLAGWVASKSLVGEVEQAWQLMLQSYERSTQYPVGCRIDVPVWECPEHLTESVALPEALRAHMIEQGYPVPRR